MSELAERVKFWEEQQRINALLVPRVVDTAHRVSQVVAQVAALSTDASQLDARLEGRCAILRRALEESSAGLRARNDALGRQIRELHNEQVRLVGRLDELEATVKPLGGYLETSHAHLARELLTLTAEVRDLRQRLDQGASQESSAGNLNSALETAHTTSSGAGDGSGGRSASAAMIVALLALFVAVAGWLR